MVQYSLGLQPVLEAHGHDGVVVAVGGADEQHGLEQEPGHVHGGQSSRHLGAVQDGEARMEPGEVGLQGGQAGLQIGEGEGVFVPEISHGAGARAGTLDLRLRTGAAGDGEGQPWLLVRGIAAAAAAADVAVGGGSLVAGDEGEEV